MSRTRTLAPLALVVALALGALALSGCGTTIVSGDGTVIRSITASGEGKALAAPDTAEMTFGATASGSDPKAVLAEANSISSAIVDAVKSAGVADEDIQTSGVSLYPQYDYSSGGKAATITGYEAQVSIMAKVRDIATLGEVITAASEAGATNIYGPSWSLSEDAAQANLAIENAITDARQRAEAMATAAGVSIGEVITVTESSVSSPIIYSDRAYAAEAGADSMAIEPGNLEVMASVTVTFVIE